MNHVSHDRLTEKLNILADAAKYDVSCSSSGSTRKNDTKGLGDTGAGICHTYTEDGRCVSLLKILLTNHCIYDCAYCVSRKSNDIKRAAFTIEEVVSLTINFYRRNYIEGLFLSSGIFKNADYTLERLVAIARKLRQEQNFNGYIHLKIIPGASDELVRQAGLYADRVSVNLEIANELALKKLAPEKNHQEVIKPMSFLSRESEAYQSDKQLIKSTPLFMPAGQSSQLVIGASEETDKDVLFMADRLYRNYRLKRVYYSGYIPISDSNNLPGIGTPPPLIREHRLYQSDWLVRFYGFKMNEIVSDEAPQLDLEIDPKLTWALRNPQFFPLNINEADYEAILRVPGIGVMSAQKIIQARRFSKLGWEQLKKIGISVNKAKYFIFCSVKDFSLLGKNPATLRGLLTSSAKSKYKNTLSPQLTLF